ncbi:MAG: glutamine-hydrolyzing GMP synthase [Clostridia bacterium]|nr:glutamine-hydrolyzing GMP synthase [Clostridia bacterium]
MLEKKELILILDFGGQYNQLIARRVRECNVYSEVVPYDITIEKIKEKNPKGIIFTGGPASVYGEDSPRCAKEIFELGIPVLGICYGMQLMTHILGGNVARADKREYGATEVNIDNSSVLFEGFDTKNNFLMSHTDFVETVPEGFKNIASTDTCPNAGMENKERNLYGIQFHPEVNLSVNGTQVIKNFLFNICKCSGDWTMSSFVQDSIKMLKEKIGDKKALCALSGGVDSSVAAVLLSKAIGKNLTCIFVDHGLLRKNEGDEVEKIFTEQYDLNFIRVNAKDRFLEKLAGVTDPEKKRKIIGEEFIRVFEQEAKKLGTIDFLVQGTIYPDVIESGLGKSAVIKSHHNVGGLPDYVDFKEIVEPLRSLFKDEVRKTGLELGIPENLVFRQPFPGPGLAIRIIGDITEDKLNILKEADSIFREEIANSGLHKSINQYFAVLTNLRSVGVMGDERTYDYTVALRAVETTDFMTGVWSRIPYDVLDKVSSRIVNEVDHVNRVCYDITSKPPATIEWE